MKEKMAKLISSTGFSIAQKSASTASTWRTFQPKVPQKLLKEKK